MDQLEPHLQEKINSPIHIIGGGMAGCEAAWQCVSADVPVILHEMRPVRTTDAHHTDSLAEMVCSNSFRSDDAENNAVGLLHAEMRMLGSLIMEMGDAHKVPAGSALAVDRDAFSAGVTEKLKAHPLVTLERGEIADLPPEDWKNVIVATGPLTSPAFSEAILKLCGEDSLAFFDAIAPIINKDSIDFDKAWYQSRYDKGDGADYINLPLSEDQYNRFIDDILAAEKADFKDWEKDTPYFEGCMPIEVMAERGRETLRFGPMKPVGLTNPHSDQATHAVIQLRQDNKLGTLYNMVGFQTKMKHGEQTRIFRTIPGLEGATFARLGGLHRNTFLNSPLVLDDRLRMKADPRLRFAGQITGVEGYVESAAMGLIAGRMAAAEYRGLRIPPLPATTAFGALLSHITGGHIPAKGSFQPMNVNFGLFPPPQGRINKKERKPTISKRARADLQAWIITQQETAA